MSQDINLGGTIYVSSKRAAEITGYSQDYIGQLARSGQIDARRVAGLWYILEESLLQHKHKADEFIPTPPTRVTAEVEASVSFDGQDYISASRAAKITGYSQDYVGQLARSEKIPSRQIGSRWYVDRAAIIEHKRHNDSLLGAVQAESVGILRPESQQLPENASSGVSEAEPHYNYIQEDLSPMPVFGPEQPDQDDISDPSLADTQGGIGFDQSNEHQIPIRVMQKEVRVAENATPKPVPSVHDQKSQTARIAIFFVAFLGVIAVAGAAYWQRSQIVALDTSSALASVNSSAVDVLAPIATATGQAGSAIRERAGAILSKELEYRRETR